MAHTREFMVDTYTITHYSPEVPIKGTLPKRSYSSQILLYGNWESEGTKELYRVHMFFVSGCISPPAGTYYHMARSTGVYLLDKYYDKYVDLLRNEKPVYVRIEFSGGDPNKLEPVKFSLSSGEEPQGEGE